jgi:hypothetical protein
MAKRESVRKDKATPTLSLKIETTDANRPNVTADDFLATAEKWLNALKAFAQSQGQQVKWEIVDLRKSSAFIQVQPVKIKTGKPAPTLVRTWDQGISQIERTGRASAKFTPTSINALADFVLAIPKNNVVYVGNGLAVHHRQVTAVTQKRVEEAARRMLAERREYVSQGSIRGRLAVLNSWNPEERSFQLQLPLAPNRPIKCTYQDGSLATELGEGFEGNVEITGQLRYRPDEPWPYSADVERIRVLPRKSDVSLKDLVGLLRLPEGQDSVSYIRSLRDAD